MDNIIIIAVIAVIVFAAGVYVYKAKKSGKKCIGCPDGCSCDLAQKNGSDSCGCGCCDGMGEKE